MKHAAQHISCWLLLVGKKVILSIFIVLFT